MIEEEKDLNEEEKIKLENFLLQSEIILKGGSLSQSNDFPSEVENQFLKNILAFENAERKAVFEIIGVKKEDFLSSNKLNDKEIDQKLNEFIGLFDKNDISLDLVKGVPNRLIYDFLVEEYLFNKSNLVPVGIGGWVIDGCSGDCPSCFQLNYCTSKGDIWSPEELAAERYRRKEEDF